MRIENIKGPSFGMLPDPPRPGENLRRVNAQGYRISARENKDCYLLYNKVSDLIKEEKVGATFKRDSILIPSDKPSIRERLKALGIKFTQKTENK